MDPFDVLATCAAYSAMKMASLGTEEQLAICVGGAVVLGCALGSKKVRLSASGCTQYRYRQVGCLALMNVSCAAQDDSKDIRCTVGCEVLPCIAAGFVQLTSSLALTDDSPTAACAALSSGLACCGVATLWHRPASTPMAKSGRGQTCCTRAPRGCQCGQLSTATYLDMTHSGIKLLGMLTPTTHVCPKSGDSGRRVY